MGFSMINHPAILGTSIYGTPLFLWAKGSDPHLNSPAFVEATLHQGQHITEAAEKLGVFSDSSGNACLLCKKHVFDYVCRAFRIFKDAPAKEMCNKQQTGHPTLVRLASHLHHGPQNEISVSRTLPRPKACAKPLHIPTGRKDALQTEVC